MPLIPPLTSRLTSLLTLPPRRELWLPGEQVDLVAPRYRATNVLLSDMSQESYIRVKSQAVRVNAGQFIMRIASERGGPRYAVSLAVTPSQVRLAEADRAALARVHGDCCPGAAVYAGGPCKA
jgi:hypothetical protein